MKSDTIETIIERYEKGFYQPHSEERRKEATAGSAELAAIREENARLRAGIVAVQGLIEESRGVDGLHLNGDLALWEELLAGGRFEEWLKDFSAALSGEPSGEVLVDRKKLQEIREELVKYLVGGQSLKRFVKWFMAVFIVEALGDAPTPPLLAAIQHALVEYSGGLIDEERLRARLSIEASRAAEGGTVQGGSQ